MFPPSFLILLTLTLTTAIDIATHDEASSSMIPGFPNTPSKSLPGDFLTSTFCYCTPTDPTFPPSHYYQIDYYNHHQNKSFFLQQTCHHGLQCSDCEPHHPGCDINTLLICDQPTKCLPEGLSEKLLAGKNVGNFHRKWWRLSFANIVHLNPWDKLWYLPDFDGQGKDFVKFDGKKRDLSPLGGQGMRFEPREEVQRVCNAKCKEQLGAEVLVMPGVMLSHQVVYENLDDMCFGCH